MAEETQKPKKAAPEKGVYVRAVYGDMRHLFTNVVFTSDPKKVELDSFIQSQIDAGKMEIVQP